MAKTIILVRHGETDANIERRYAGATDSPLNDNGHAGALALRPELERLAPNRIVASPLDRTMETARLSVNGLGVDIETDDDLREVDFGEWENLTYEEITRRSGDKANGLMTLEPEFRFPGGESVGKFSERVARARISLIESDADTVAAFTHGGVIGAMLCQLLGAPMARHMFFRIPPASVTLLEVAHGMCGLRAIYTPNGGDAPGPVGSP